jgi:hypothetical protein
MLQTIFIIRDITDNVDVSQRVVSPVLSHLLEHGPSLDQAYPEK